MCNNIQIKIWGLTLFSGLWLLFMCVVFGNTPPNTLFYRLVLYFAPIGGGLFALSVFAACCYKPLHRELFGPFRRSVQNQSIVEELNNEPKLTKAVYQNMIPVAKPVDNSSSTTISNDTNGNKQEEVIIAEKVNIV